VAMGIGTSISDDGIYPAFCEAASTEDELFGSFKRDPRYRTVLEHVTPAQGLAYFEMISQNFPFLADRMDAFRANDTRGAPLMHDYGEPLGRWSPTTLRYAKVVGDLVSMFDQLNGFDIAEIGAGYGGQCLLLSQLVRWRSYTIFDLAPVQKLQRRYLAELGVEKVGFESVDSLKRGTRYDLVISNYAFSECTRRIQDLYLAGVLDRSDRGYLTCNNLIDDCYSEPELRERIPNAIGFPEIPLTNPNNYLLIWNRASPR
jgi:hypothetical protein